MNIHKFTSFAALLICLSSFCLFLLFGRKPFHTFHRYQPCFRFFIACRLIMNACCLFIWCMQIRYQSEQLLCMDLFNILWNIPWVTNNSVGTASEFVEFVSQLKDQRCKFLFLNYVFASNWPVAGSQPIYWANGFLPMSDACYAYCIVIMAFLVFRTLRLRAPLANF